MLLNLIWMIFSSVSIFSCIEVCTGVNIINIYKYSNNIIDIKKYENYYNS